MHVRYLIEVSHDEREWSPFGFSGSIPTVLYNGWEFMRVTLLYIPEPGDAEVTQMPPLPKPPPKRPR